MKNILAENTIGFQKATEVIIPEIFNHRIVFGITVLDKIFGGGILPGSSFTMDAAKGAGKTTLLLQCLQVLAEQGLTVGYISGEECKEQVAYTCKRLGVRDVLLATYTHEEEIIKCMDEGNLDFLIVDSWQRIVNNDGSSIRTESNQKEVIQRLCDAAKANNCVFGVIMQRTKTGKVKGASEIQHTVDANYEIEIDDNNPETYRHISSSKNRFGPLGEQTLEMGAHGYNFESNITEDDMTGLKNAMAPAVNANIRCIKANNDKQKIISAIRANGPMLMSKLHKASSMSYQKAMELSTIMMNDGLLTFDGKKWDVAPPPAISPEAPESKTEEEK